MNTILVFVIAVGAVSADVGLGYNYKVPQTSYGVPSYQINSNSGSSNYNYNSGASGNNGYVYRGPSGYQGLSAGQGSAYQGGYTGLQSGVANGAGYQTAANQYQSGVASGAGYQSAGNQYQSAGNQFQSAGVGNQYYTSPSTSASSSAALSNTLVQPHYQVGASSGQSGYQTFNQYQTQYQEKYQHQYQYQQQPAQVFKHFYVHAAPEEPEPVRPRNPIVLPPPQKHYKIIFIKTPAPVGAPPQYIPVQPQNEEKTIVYVLVKKPEDFQDVVLPKVEPKPPSKPEVYFIKYNSKEDSQAVINNIVNDYNSKGQSASFSNTGADASSGLYAGQSSASSGLVTGVSSAGFSELASGGSGQIAGSQTESQLLSNLGSSFGQTSSTENQQANFGAAFGSESLNLSTASAEAGGNSASSAFSTLTSNQDSANAISTSQGVPHETYGVPKFKVE